MANCWGTIQLLDGCDWHEKIKRRASGVDWEGKVDCKTLKVMQEILVDVEKKDPVTRAWPTPETKIRVVWCDASSIATGVVMEISALVVEYVTWLKKK